MKPGLATLCTGQNVFLTLCPRWVLAKAEFFVGFNPAGKMEDYFKKLGDGSTKNFADEQREAMRKEHGFETSGPPIVVKKKYTH